MAYLVLAACPPSSGPPLAPPGAVLPKVGQSYPLTAGQNIIGRNAPPQSISATIDLVFLTVSRRHALIEYNGLGTWEIEDLRSRNGTFVNGQPLPPNTRMPLNDGDRVSLGGGTPPGIELQFCLQLVPGPPAPQSNQPAPEEVDLPIPLIARRLEPHETAEFRP
jgi:predicted component of type VI protein secretion system